MNSIKKEIINKDKLVSILKEETVKEEKLVKKIIRQIDQARKKPKIHLNINKEQLKLHLSQIIKTWKELKTEEIINCFLNEIVTNLKERKFIQIWGRFSLEVHKMLNKKKNRIRFRASPKLIREINFFDSKKIRNYCSEHQIARKKHKTSNCCDKTQGIKAYASCIFLKNLWEQIRKCQRCNLN